VVRHPLDVCVSVMANDMTHGFNCGYRVEDVAHHLNAVSDLVAHYRTQMDSADYVIRYESLVAAPAAETQQLMEYLGLPLQQAQIDVPINGSSVGRHLQQVDALQPYGSRLQKLMAAHGYS
jgi:hypothetical protein